MLIESFSEFRAAGVGDLLIRRHNRRISLLVYVLAERIIYDKFSAFVGGKYIMVFRLEQIVEIAGRAAFCVRMNRNRQESGVFRVYIYIIVRAGYARHVYDYHSPCRVHLVRIEMFGTRKPRSEMGADQIADLLCGLYRIFLLDFLGIFAERADKQLSDLRADGRSCADLADYR